MYVCQSLHEYFSASLSREDNTHVMRSLQSSTWPHPSLGAPLEPPNSLQGEPAASENIIITHSLYSYTRIIIIFELCLRSLSTMYIFFMCNSSPPLSPSLPLFLHPVLTLCELRGIPCMDHILYASSSLTERERVLAFLPTFNQMSSAGVPLKDLPIRVGKGGDVI